MWNGRSAPCWVPGGMPARSGRSWPGTTWWLHLNRAVDDDDEDEVRRALDDGQERGLTTISRKASTRLKVELDLPAQAVEAAPLQADITYPEWDYARRVYHKDHCRVLTGRA